MTDILIYTKDYCPYCQSAKALLTRKNVKFTEIDILVHPEMRGEMLKASGGKSSVPQIFINGTHVGGSDDLHALEAAGKLNAMLK